MLNGLAASESAERFLSAGDAAAIGAPVRLEQAASRHVQPHDHDQLTTDLRWIGELRKLLR